jgi:capsular exopolysaccharide synthesis family protein
MSRFAEALKRARTGSVSNTAPEDERSENAIRFFAPGQPAIVSPWDIDREREGSSTSPEPSRSPHPVHRTAPADVAERGLHRDERHRGERSLLPTGEGAEKLVVSPALAQHVREHYNKLAAVLHQLQLERSIKVVMITSAAPREGKTLTSVNLALTLSESYQRRVLLVDADLRHPTVHGTLGIANTRGLTESLTRVGPLPLVEVTARLSVLTAGNGAREPMKTLISDRMRALVEEARAEFDWVLLDTAPIGLLPDASLLASMADGALFVIRAGQTAYDAVQRAVEAVGTARILGLVLNGVGNAALPESYYSNYYERVSE